jgi:hypothetical protein
VSARAAEEMKDERRKMREKMQMPDWGNIFLIQYLRQFQVLPFSGTKTSVKTALY